MTGECVASAVEVDDGLLGAGWAVRCLCGYESGPRPSREHAERQARAHESAPSPGCGNVRTS